jgi:hypothetical protein
MSVESIKITIDGITPILMHCGQTADPLNHFARAMKTCSKKRNKTDEDLEELSLLEWWAGLYLSRPPQITDSTVTPHPDTSIVIPAHLLDSCIREGARKSKLGKQASAGCIVECDGTFEHDGPSDLAALSKDQRHHHRCAVKVGTAKVMRTRPVFPVWSVAFSVSIDTSVIEPTDVITAVSNAGKLVGIGDWRPGAPRGGSYGRFVVGGSK